jgi:hypothetical protein
VYLSSSPVNRAVDPKQIATEIINTPAFSLAESGVKHHKVNPVIALWYDLS